MLSPGTTVGSYEIVAHLGTGGMGEVYKVRDSRLGRLVALKVLSARDISRDAMLRIEREARVASSLAHPNICHIYALEVTPEGTPFIAMEYVDGQTLRNRISVGPLSVPEAVEVARQMAAALTAAGAVSIVHRDIKPENVMLGPEGLVKVVDFGLAKFRVPFGSDGDGSTRTVAQTDAGTVLGTVAYMAPEQARGEEVDVRTDLWALGAVVYEMVSGQAAFVGSSGSDVIAAILGSEPPALVASGAPPELQRIISKALSKDRSGRYQTAREMLSDFTALAADLTGSDGKVSPRKGKTSLSPRVVGAAVLVVSVISWAAWYARSIGSTSFTPAGLAPAPAPTHARRRSHL